MNKSLHCCKNLLQPDCFSILPDDLQEANPV